MKIIYENDKIKVSETGRNYDFIGIIESKSNDNWVGILADAEGYATLNKYKYMKD